MDVWGKFLFSVERLLSRINMWIFHKRIKRQHYVDKAKK